jgi:photosystem II stability/assembly factor-like uncharacterized protein
MSVTSPPRRPEIEQDRDLEQRVADLEALIEEARRRARRRRSIYAAIVLALLGAATWASFDIGGSGGVSLGRSDASGTAGAAAAQAGAARWQSLRGPEGGYVFAVAIDPADSKIAYAGTWGTVFKSTDGGARWKDTSTGEPWTRVAALAIDPTKPNVVYAGTERGAAKTTDGGRHWRLVNAGLFDRAPLPPRTAFGDESAIGSLTVDAQHPATVYATTTLGLYRTRNGGSRWQIIGPLPFRNAICRTCAVHSSGYGMSFAIDPSNAQTIYASWAGYRNGAPVPSNFYKSSDGGDSWRRITMATPLSFSALVLTASGALLATDESKPGVYRSTDGGTTWSPAGLPGETIYPLIADPGSGAIYATTRRRAVFRTTDGGDSWQTAPANLAYGQIVSDPTDPATIYAAGGDGVVKSVDHGHTWAAADKGIVSTMISTLAIVPGSTPTLYAGTGSRVFKSTDRGLTWRTETAGLDGDYLSTLAVDPQHPRTIFAGMRGGLFESANAGVSWSRVRTGFPDEVVPALAIDPQHPNTVYVSACRGGCGGPGSLLKTVDGGATWRQLTTIPGPVQSLAIDPRAGSTVFAGTPRGGIFRSTDAGSSWQRVAIAHGVPAATSHLGFPFAVVAIAVNPLDPNTIYAGSRTGGILKSTDGGTRWAAANAGLTNLDMYALVVDPHNPQVLFASTQGGVFRSSNSGESWRPYDRGLPAGGVAAFAVDPAGGTVYAGTNGDGVHALQLGG